MESLPLLIETLGKVFIEFKDKDAKFISNEIMNMIDCFYMSDRESTTEEQSGIKDNIFKINEVLKQLPTY